VKARSIDRPINSWVGRDLTDVRGLTDPCAEEHVVEGVECIGQRDAELGPLVLPQTVVVGGE
jgi:hypothetical protein